MKTLIAILTLTAVVSFTETKATTRESVSTTHDSLSAPVVDAKILGKFKKAYPEINNPNWQDIPDGYMVSFKEGDILRTWVYNKKHGIGYDIKSYGKAHLPAGVVSRIENAYNEYDIESAEEINVLGKVYYFVKITSNKFRKLVKMDDYEIYASESMPINNNR